MTIRLPNETERALYREILAQGGRVMFREAMQQDPEAVLGLIDLGLLVHHDTDESLTAVNPRAVGARLSTELRGAATRKLVQAERAAEQLDDLSQAYDSTPQRVDRRSEVQHVATGQQIRHRIMQIEAEMREEALALQPGGARPTPFLRQSLVRDRAFLTAGVALRTVYQPGALTHRPTVSYAASLTGAGERIRVLDEPFVRLLVFDRKVAIIPASADYRSAAFVEDPVLVALLVERFERDWARAAIVDWHALAGRPRESGVPPELTDLLAAGLTQRAIASRLGLSERTVAAHIARLREQHGAETLFQLGWLMRGGA
ncbi:LuxR C-terminal-related transcriptional regulator [Kitasatospora sp. NPDC057198]|uniref:LuxR C-terminal-related transcriptional regulator n=1 Tax=Kitasatospora sp. NPDC057198 TaxID=3346046 RepID=UPI00363F166A